jgi:hypothetical protein
LAGMQTIFASETNFTTLLAKLEGLKKIDTEFYLYRKTIFEAISLLRGLAQYG